MFVTKQYHRVMNAQKKILQRVYDCLNSWGFKDPIITIPTKHPAIMGIYKITPVTKRLVNSPDRQRRSSGAQGSISEDFLYGCKND